MSTWRSTVPLRADAASRGARAPDPHFDLDTNLDLDPDYDQVFFPDFHPDSDPHQVCNPDSTRTVKKTGSESGSMSR